MKSNIIHTKILNMGIRILIAIFVVTIFLYWQNNDIVVTEFEYKNGKIPAEFDGFSIVQVSDLHNKQFGKNQQKLITEIERANPDIIVITGDLVDRRKYNLETSMEFVNQAVKYAPVYYVSGNHEAWSGEYETIKDSLVKAGVTVLDDEETDITRGSSKISILGLKDPDFRTSSYIEGTDSRELEAQLQKWSHEESFKVLLSHRPEMFEFYMINNMDIVFSGHAHGGQFRIPFLGGLVAPDQGLFPKYSGGRYEGENTTMFLSRGLGNSIIPVRLGNRPELIKVTLKSE